MITSAIGRIFLNAYNEKYGTQYDARTFFIEQFYPLFFDQKKYMMTAGNSPLENPKLSWDDMIKGKKPYETPEKRKERFTKLMQKIENSDADASIARGFPSLDEKATTSGQVTDMVLTQSKDDIFLSWIGDALGVGVQGGFSILFNHKDILLDVFNGWKYYRCALNNTANLKGNQINTWNGQWLSHYYDSRDFNSANPMAGFNPYSTDKEIMNISTQTWTKVLIGVCRKFKDVQVMGYIYSIGQTNTTIGFIPINLTQIRRPVQLYNRLFGSDDGRQAELLWGTATGLKASCTDGVIGLKAMEPKGLRGYITKGNLPKPAKNDEQKISYNVYKIWLLAMLNNDELWDKSHALAELLNAASTNKDKKVSTKPKNLVEAVLKSVNKKQFIDTMKDILPLAEQREKLVEIVKEVHKMPTDNVPYFLTLLRFHYEALK